MNKTSEEASKLTSLMVERVADIGLLDSWFDSLINEKLIEVCESHIEIMLGAAMLLQNILDNRSYWLRKEGLFLSRPGEDSCSSLESDSLIPQFKFGDGEYRIDWVYRHGSEFIFIECDGHDFHERTKEQALHDRQKDRKIQLAGYPILRFTGSEIYRDPFHCASQVTDLAESLIHRCSVIECWERRLSYGEDILKKEISLGNLGSREKISVWRQDLEGYRKHILFLKTRENSA